MNLLPWTIYVSFAGSFLALVAGARSAAAARWTALATAVAATTLPFLAARDFVPGTGQAEMGIGSLAAMLFLFAFLPLSYLFWFVTERLSGGVAGAVLMHAALNAGITFGGVSSNAAMAVVLGTATVAALAVAALTRRVELPDPLV